MTGRRLLLTATRVGVPLAMAAAGVAAIVVEHGHDNSTSAAGVALIIAALIVWMINWMFRMSVQSNRDRDREEEARRYFDEHGRWPDE
jgi:drug/metabolite transporter (DMT)-like permease